MGLSARPLSDWRCGLEDDCEASDFFFILSSFLPGHEVSTFLYHMPLLGHAALSQAPKQGNHSVIGCNFAN